MAPNISKVILSIVSRIHEDPFMLYGDEKSAHSNHNKHWILRQLAIVHHPKNWNADTYYPTTVVNYLIVTVV